MYDYVRITYESGEQKEGFLTDLDNGIGLMQERQTNTAFFAHEVVLDVLAPAEPPEHSQLPHYPFERGDVVLFEEQGETQERQVSGFFLRTSSYGPIRGVTLALSENTMVFVRYSAIRQLRKASCTFPVPPGREGAGW